MTQTAAPAWHAKRTPETNMVEETLKKEGFERADAYRYNSASIRVRVIDNKFEGMPCASATRWLKPFSTNCRKTRSATS